MKMSNSNGRLNSVHRGVDKVKEELFDYTHRIIGLDIVRCIAIFYVVWGHGALLIPNELKEYYGLFTFLPIDGVSVFFVLSGFLIGTIQIRTIEKTAFSFSDLINFWKRRWYRTLPAYYVVLLFLIVFKFSEWNFDTRFFFFLQNLYKQHPDFYHVSWSLAIEEWFYLLFPLVFFLLRFKLEKNRALILSVLFFLIAPLILRVFNYYDFGVEQVEERKVVLFRLDSMMYGITLAIIKRWQARLWHFLQKWGPGIFVVLIAAIFLGKPDAYRIYREVLIYNMESLTVFVILPFLYGIKTTSSSLLNSFLAFNSKISYSMYLVHGNVVLWWWVVGLQPVLEAQTQVPFLAIRMGLFLVYIFLSYGISILLFLTIEQPFMKLRERYTQAV